MVPSRYSSGRNAMPMAGDLRVRSALRLFLSHPPTNPPIGLYESDGSGRVEGDTIHTGHLRSRVSASQSCLAIMLMVSHS